jgi:hypothetical protein
MQLATILNAVRILLAEPEPVGTNQGRWSDTDLTTLVNQAHTQIALDIDWPESTYTGYTLPNIQEYQMPETLKILRVYLGGQPIVPTTIPALQGDQIEVWDQSSPGNTPGWVYQPAQSYPFLQTSNGGGYGTNAGNTPWHQNERPRFYTRGGNLGFVPMPNGAFYVQVDLIPQPPVLINAADVSIYQTTFLDAIVWKTCEYAMFADSNALTSMCSSNYQSELVKLRAWKSDYVKMLPKGVFPITARTFFQGPVYKRMTSRSG